MSLGSASCGSGPRGEVGRSWERKAWTPRGFSGSPMRAIRPLVIWLVGLALVGFLAWVGYWTATIFSLRFECEYVVLEEATSPRGEYVATAFERNCGATTTLDRRVSLRPANAPFEPEQDVVVLRVGGLSQVSIRWAADDRLVLRAKGPSTILERRDSWERVRIELLPD